MVSLSSRIDQSRLSDCDRTSTDSIASAFCLLPLPLPFPLFFLFSLSRVLVYNWVIVLPAELSAASILISFWSDLNPAIWISIILVVVVAINFAGVKVYGETEFWFCSLKVLLIVGLIILSFILDLGGGPSGDRLGFRYWKDPGVFVQYADIPGALGRFLGFWAVLIQAGFSFIGCEIVAIAGAEAANPRRNVAR